MEEKYGKIVYEVTNEDILKCKAKTEKIMYVLLYGISIVCFLLGIWCATEYSKYADSEDKLITIAMFSMGIILIALVELVRRKEAKKDYSDYSTYIYENGFFVNQGKPFDMGFDVIKTMSYHRMRNRGYYIFIETTREPRKERNVVIGVDGIPVLSDVRTLYNELNKAFVNYKNENQTEL